MGPFMSRSGLVPLVLLNDRRYRKGRTASKKNGYNDFIPPASTGQLH